MKRLLRFALMLAVTLTFVPFLPFYIEQTMMRSFMSHGGGDRIDWGWRFCTLYGYWDKYAYKIDEENPALWLAVNLTLMLVYAALIALAVDQFLVRRKRRKARA